MVVTATLFNAKEYDATKKFVAHLKHQRCIENDTGKVNKPPPSPFVIVKHEISREFSDALVELVGIIRTSGLRPGRENTLVEYVDGVRKNYNDGLNALTDEYEKDKEKWQEKVDELEQQILDLNGQIESMKNGHASDMEVLQQRLETTQFEELEQLTKLYDDKVVEIQSLCNAKIKQTQEEYEEQLCEMRAKTKEWKISFEAKVKDAVTVKIDTLKIQSESQLQAVISQLDKETQTITNALQVSRQQVQSLQHQLSVAQAEITKLDAKVSIQNEQIEQHKQKLAHEAANGEQHKNMYETLLQTYQQYQSQTVEEKARLIQHHAFQQELYEQQLQQSKQEELDRLHERVKQAISMKSAIIDRLDMQLNEAVNRAQVAEATLDQINSDIQSCSSRTHPTEAFPISSSSLMSPSPMKRLALNENEREADDEEVKYVDIQVDLVADVSVSEFKVEIASETNDFLNDLHTSTLCQEDRGTEFVSIWKRYEHLVLFSVDLRARDEVCCFLSAIEELQQSYKDHTKISAGDWPLKALEIVAEELYYVVTQRFYKFVALPLRILSRAVRWKRNQAVLLKIPIPDSESASMFSFLLQPLASFVHKWLIQPALTHNDIELVADIIQYWSRLLEICFVGSSSHWKEWSDVGISTPDIFLNNPSSNTNLPDKVPQSAEFACYTAMDHIHHEWIDYFFDSKKATPVGLITLMHHAIPQLQRYRLECIASILTVLQSTRAYDTANLQAVSMWIPLQLDLLSLLGSIICVNRKTILQNEDLVSPLFDLIFLDAKNFGSVHLMTQQTIFACMVLRVALEVCEAQGNWHEFTEKFSLITSTIRWIQDTSFKLASSYSEQSNSLFNTPKIWALTRYPIVFGNPNNASSKRIICYTCQHHRHRWCATGFAVQCFTFTKISPTHQIFHQANLCIKAIFDTLYLAYSCPALKYFEAKDMINMMPIPICTFLEHMVLAIVDIIRATRKYESPSGITIELHAMCFIRHIFQLQPHSIIVPAGLQQANAWKFLWHHHSLFMHLGDHFSKAMTTILGDIRLATAEIAVRDPLTPLPRFSLVLNHALVASVFLLIVHALPEKTSYFELAISELNENWQDPWFATTMFNILDDLLLTEEALFKNYLLANFSKIVIALQIDHTVSAASNIARFSALRFIHNFFVLTCKQEDACAVQVLQQDFLVACFRDRSASFLPWLFEMLYEESYVAMVLNVLQSLLYGAIELMFDPEAVYGPYSSGRFDFLHSHLVQMFVQSLSELISESSSYVGPTVCCMLDIIHGILASTQYIGEVQVLLRNCSIFIHLSNLMHSRHYVGTSEHCVVVRKVGYILTLLMAHNRESKAEFRSLMGSSLDDHERIAYEPLVHICLTAESSPSWATLAMLWSMMVDNDETSLRIYNPDTIPVVLALFKHCAFEVQDKFLKNFLRLFLDSSKYAHLNRSMCCYVQPATVDQIMDLLETGCDSPLLMQVMVEIGQHSIGVKQLKRYFRLLQRPAMAKLSSLLVMSLYQMIRPRAIEPNRFFFFDGDQSGLEVSNSFTFPTRGFTFHTWIYLEDELSSDKHTLFCICDAEQRIYHCYVQSGIVCYVTPNDLAPFCTNVQLMRHRWYSFSFVHSSGSFRTPSEAILCINGDICWRSEAQPISFASNSVESCYIGCSVQDDGVSLGNMGRMRMGSIYFLKKALSAKNLHQLFRRGPNMILDPKDSFSDYIVWSYSPSVWEGQYFHDSSLNFQEIMPLLLAARRLEGTYHIYTRYLVDVLDCIGGVAVVFPLLAQFDSETSQDLASNVLKLLGAVLHEHEANQRFMQENNGVVVMGYLLSRMAPRHMSYSVLETMRSLLINPWAHPHFQSLIIKHWVGDFNLWVFTPLNVQLHVVSILRFLIEQTDLPWQEHITVRKLLDDLRLYYWFTPPMDIWSNENGAEPLLSPSNFEKGKFNQRDWIHPETKASVASHLSAAECQQVRFAIIDLIEVLIKAKPQIEPCDVTALIGFLGFSGDDTQKSDILNLILQLLTSTGKSERLHLVALFEKEMRKLVNTPESNLDPHYRITPCSAFGAPITAMDIFFTLVLRRMHLSGEVKLTAFAIVSQCLGLQAAAAQIEQEKNRPHSVSLPATVLAKSLMFKPPRLSSSHTDVRFESHLRRISSYSFSDSLQKSESMQFDAPEPEDHLAHIYLLCSLECISNESYDDFVSMSFEMLRVDKCSAIVPAMLSIMLAASLPHCINLVQVLFESDIEILRIVFKHPLQRFWILLLKRCQGQGHQLVVLNLLVEWVVYSISTATKGWTSFQEYLALMGTILDLSTELRSKFIALVLRRLQQYHVEQPFRFSTKSSKWQYVSTNPSDSMCQQWLIFHSNVWHVIFLVEYELFDLVEVSHVVAELWALLHRMEMLYWMSFPVEIELSSWLPQKGGIVRTLLGLLYPHSPTLLKEYLSNEQFPHSRQDIVRYILRLLSALVEASRSKSSSLSDVTMDLLRRYRAVLRLRYLDVQSSRSPKEITPDNVLEQLRTELGLPLVCWDDWYDIVPLQHQSEANDLWRHDMSCEYKKAVSKCTMDVVRLELLSKLCNSHRFASKIMDVALFNAMQWERSVWKFTSDVYEKQRMNASHTWLRILRSLTNERGAWGQELPQESCMIQWKLDSSENGRHERCKLKRFYSVPETSFPSVLMISQNEAQVSLTTELLQAKALAAYNEDFYEKLKQQEERDILASEDVKIESSDPNKSIATFDCDWIAKTKSIECQLHLYTNCFLLIMEPKKKQKKFMLQELTQLEYRQYQFRPWALEFFFKNGMSIFLNLREKNACTLLQQTIRYMQPSNLQSSLGRTPRARFEHSSATQMWIERKMSNFDYLMHLNFIAGRTYNDLAQYPIFPWVLADYTSDTLNLTNPSTFRDLSRPIGAQNDASMSFFQERYKVLEMEYLRFNSSPMMADDMPHLPPFHYGTHYSCSAFVIGVGKVDHADRLFHSIDASYRSCTSNPSDVRELIPEFFYLPEFLVNVNQFPFGNKQNGEVVDNVILPPWAQGSQHNFIHLHRLALESDYVSSQLHRWIDLIFGFKQRPPLFGGTSHAVDACNVYFHLTYNGAVDLDKLQQTDPALYATTLRQIDCFGQTPPQLLFKPHPARMPSTDQIFSMTQTTNWVGYPRLVASKAKRPIICLTIDEDGCCAIDTNRWLSIHKWKGLPPDREPPFTISAIPTTMHAIGVPFATRAVTTYAESAVALSNYVFLVRSKHVFSCGHWDHSIKVTPIDGGQVQSVRQHHDVVTCLAISDDNSVLVSGSYDNTLMIWPLFWKDKTCVMPSTPNFVIYGHDDGVTSIAVSTDYDLVLSASRDGTIIVHTLSNGRYIRTIRPAPDQAIARLSYVGLSKYGSIIIYCDTKSTLYRFSINGELLATAIVDQKVQSIVLTSDGESILAGGRGQYISIYRLHDLSLQRDFDGSDESRNIRSFQSAIRSMCLSSDEMHLLVGLGNGEVCIYTPNAHKSMNVPHTSPHISAVKRAKTMRFPSHIFTKPASDSVHTAVKTQMTDKDFHKSTGAITVPARLCGVEPIHPHSTFMRNWDILSIALLLFTAIVTPFETAFLSPSVDALFVINIFVDCCFVMDMLIRFFLAYFDSHTNMWITDARLIIKHYLRGWFIVDFLSIIPFDVFGLVLTSPILSQMRFMRIMRLFRLMKIVRVVRDASIFQYWEVKMSVSYGTLGLAKFCFTVFMIAHWIACVFRVITDIEYASDVNGNRYNWLTDHHVGPDALIDTKASVQYVAALYWSVMTLTTIGYGDLVPSTPGERGLAIICMLLGGGTYAYVVGGVCQILSAMDASTSEFHQTIDTLNEYCQYNQLPMDLSSRLREFFFTSRSLLRETKNRNLLLAMSPGLRGEVALYNNQWISKIDFFNCSDDLERSQFITALAMVLRPECFPPSEYAIREGEYNTKMYLVERGFATRGRVMVGAGSFFGEDIILKHQQRKVAVRAFTYLHTQVLTKFDLDDILTSGLYPEIYRNIRCKIFKTAFRNNLVKISQNDTTIKRMSTLRKLSFVNDPSMSQGLSRNQSLSMSNGLSRNQMSQGPSFEQLEPQNSTKTLPTIPTTPETLNRIDKLTIIADRLDTFLNRVIALEKVVLQDGTRPASKDNNTIIRPHDPTCSYPNLLLMWAIGVHIGAGKHAMDSVSIAKGNECMEEVLLAAGALLAAGMPATTAAQRAVQVLEDAPCTNAGSNGPSINLTSSGRVETDASIMDGNTRGIGCCGAVHGVKNPIALAGAILEQNSNGPVVFVGAGATTRARELAIPLVDYNETPVDARARERYEKCLLDTVGVVCMDVQGHFAAAVSSAGIARRPEGRVGHAGCPRMGCIAGSSYSWSSTGRGEDLIRSSLLQQIEFITRSSRPSTCADIGDVITSAFDFGQEMNGNVPVEGGVIGLSKACKRKRLTDLDENLIFAAACTTHSMAIGIYSSFDEKPKMQMLKNPQHKKVKLCYCLIKYTVLLIILY
ncbi:hypothetical protein THRCLA_03918 [Thraustotheca clavata]|uniref:BEACH domain-containing protein n=1 Tax=Thraustotheca clavata TaxID=74557 RepID=A0A1W0A0K1_9STRA|nr:hypothetical protein THRCLA_03918 [Thraustotheca clavata]